MNYFGALFVLVLLLLLLLLLLLMLLLFLLLLLLLRFVTAFLEEWELFCVIAHTL
ncbi:MAG: hypothetical protein VXZ27_13430 [SAR324 cluster bacterium]|jgi:hypothetical protein|nr:hypothetical protein [SAR324 cluster bacterium]